MPTTADFSEMRNLAFDLGKAQATVFPQVRAIVQKTMYDAKRDMQAEAEAGGASGGISGTGVMTSTSTGSPSPASVCGM